MLLHVESTSTYHFVVEVLPRKRPIHSLRNARTLFYVIRGGSLLRMDTADAMAARGWGCTPLLALEESKRGDATVRALVGDEESVEKVTDRFHGW